jgi:single-strand DNA-binding protein
MSNLNKALLIGRLTKDPEMRYTPSGTAVTIFSIATNRWSSGPDGEKKEFTDYHNIVAYPIGKRNLAETVAQYTRKGALVFVEGRPGRAEAPGHRDHRERRAVPRASWLVGSGAQPRDRRRSAQRRPRAGRRSPRRRPGRDPFLGVIDGSPPSTTT